MYILSALGKCNPIRTLRKRPIGTSFVDRIRPDRLSLNLH